MHTPGLAHVSPEDRHLVGHKKRQARASVARLCPHFSPDAWHCFPTATSVRSQLAAATDKNRELAADVMEEKTQRLIVVEDLANERGISRDVISEERQRGAVACRDVEARAAAEIEDARNKLVQTQGELEDATRDQHSLAVSIAELEAREKTANERCRGLLDVFQRVVPDVVHSAGLLRSEKARLVDLHAGLHHKLKGIREVLGKLNLLDANPRTFGHVFASPWSPGKQLLCRFRAAVHATVAIHRLRRLCGRTADQRVALSQMPMDLFLADEICCLAVDTADTTLALRDTDKVLPSLMKLLVPDGYNTMAPLPVPGAQSWRFARQPTVSFESAHALGVHSPPCARARGCAPSVLGSCCCLSRDLQTLGPVCWGGRRLRTRLSLRKSTTGWLRVCARWKTKRTCCLRKRWCLATK